MNQSQRRGIILEFRPKNGTDFSEFVVEYSNGRPVDLSGYEILQHSSIIDSFRKEFVDYIVEHGLSSLLRRELVLEELVPRHQSPNLIEALVKRYVQKLAVSDELIIVDRYFLAPNYDTTYPALVEKVLAPALPRLRRLTLITDPIKIDKALKNQIEARLNAKNASLVVQHATSDAFHDRFWINEQAMKGFVIGTSLNGLGKRYALIDRLQHSDVRDIVNALTAESLI